jgi:hypothetical protein
MISFKSSREEYIGNTRKPQDNSGRPRVLCRYSLIAAEGSAKKALGDLEKPKKPGFFEVPYIDTKCAAPRLEGNEFIEVPLRIPRADPELSFSRFFPRLPYAP